MWSKHGAKLNVLKQVNKVIPNHMVNQRIVVIDSYSDLNNKAIQDFKDNGWSISLNKGQGISGAANTALNLVTSNFFVSFEDDLILNKDWWNVIPNAFQDNKVVASSGFRLPSKPKFLRKLQEYSMEKYRRESAKPLFLYGKNLDNTLYRTSAIREVGGFPVLTISPGVDNVLAVTIHEKGYVWKVNFNIISTHLRKGFWHEVKQYWWYGKCYKELKRHLKDRGASLTSIFIRTLFSPIRGLLVAWKKKSPLIVFAYPIIRLTILFGVCYSFLRKVK